MSVKDKIKRIIPTRLWQRLRLQKQYYRLRPTLRAMDRLRTKRLETIRFKVQRGERIRVAFLQMYASDIQNLCIFEKMLTSRDFDPYIIINPDVMRSQDNLVTVVNRAYTESVAKYGEERVLLGYDVDSQVATDYTEQFDMAFTNNPYENMAHDYFKIEYWAKRGIPMLYIPYFYMGRCFVSMDNLRMESFNYFWKVFVENEYVIKQAKQYELVKGSNLVLSGYPKLDALYFIEERPRNRKRVIIAPHHLISDNELHAGGFRQYADDLLSLPLRFPNVDFVFRPHPLLFEALKDYWTEDQIETWKKTFFANANVEYSCGGDYLNLFKNSDALMHDCGSYTSEYFYTGKPCAYIYKQGTDYSKAHSEFGTKCRNLHYAIHTLEDWNAFIKNVVMADEDVLKEQREVFAHESVMINYPKASEFIYNHIKKYIEL